MVESCERRRCTRIRWWPEGVKSEWVKEISSSESSVSERKEMRRVVLAAEEVGVFLLALGFGRRGVDGSGGAGRAGEGDGSGAAGDEDISADCSISVAAGREASSSPAPASSEASCAVLSLLGTAASGSSWMRDRVEGLRRGGVCQKEGVSALAAWASSPVSSATACSASRCCQSEVELALSLSTAGFSVSCPGDECSDPRCASCSAGKVTCSADDGPRDGRPRRGSCFG